MKKRPVYVVGHKNPDTDAIVSAIAYAEYKKQLGVNAVAARIGSVSSETEYLLERFGYDDPVRLYTAKCTLREIDMDKAALADKDMTMKEALDKVIKLKNRGLIVVDGKKHRQDVAGRTDPKRNSRLIRKNAYVPESEIQRRRRQHCSST